MSRTGNSVEELATGRIGRLLVGYSWPALVAMSLNALYAVVDRLYIGQGCGEAAMAGLQLALPAMLFFTACGVFIGIGHATLLSIRLGEGNSVACEQVLGELVAMKVLFSVVLPPLVFLNADRVLCWCGGGGVSAEAFECARTYLRTVVFSQVFSHIAFGLSAAMRSEGDALRSMTCMVVGFGANMLLDPLLIFGTPSVDLFGVSLGVRPMGVKGAAWATNVAMALSCAFAFAHYWRRRSAVRLRLVRCRLYPRILWRTCGLGFAPFLQHLLNSFIGVALTAAFAKWAADPAAATQQIASLGVFNAMLVLTIMPIMGVQQGLQPIIGYNWGARRFARVRRALVLGYWVTTALCVTACVLQCVPPFPRLLVRLFVPGENAALADLAVHDLAIGNCMIWTISVNVVATTYFQAIGHPKVAVALSTLRQGFILLPCVRLLPRLLPDPTLAVWLSLPVSDVVCQLATLPPIFLHLRFLSRVRSRVQPGNCGIIRMTS